MNKVSPVELRISNDIAEEMTLGGMGWIPIPYDSDEDRKQLLQKALSRLEECAIKAEEEENNVKR